MAPPLSSRLLLVALLTQRLPLCSGGTVTEPPVKGNRHCWKDNFTFEHCCPSEEAGEKLGCWNGIFSYDLCCITPFRPSERCSRARDAEELLWHCRVRPHKEFDRCLGTSARPRPAGIVGWVNGRLTYQKYVEGQRQKADRELNRTFASTRALDVVSEYLRRHFRNRTRLHGVCHGAKVGREVRFLRRQLEHHSRGSRAAGFARDVSILGTDISEQASRRSRGDVILMDFHVVYTSWQGHWDFIYSNTLDHSYDPGSALGVWRWSLQGTDGLVVLHRSPFHSTLHIDSVDMYGGSMGDYCTLMRKTRFELLDIIRLPETQTEQEEDLIFAVRGSRPDTAEVLPLNWAAVGKQ